MTQGTWEEAAKAAMDGVPEGLELSCLGKTLLEEIERYLSDMHEGHGATVGNFEYICDDALQAYCENNGGPEVARAYAEDVVVQTIISKQHDYGHDNILWAGIDGLIVRMHDKVARIKNLEQRAAESTATIYHAAPGSFETTHAEKIVPGVGPVNESLADSWLDIAGYAVIAIMLLNGTFERQLAADLITDAQAPPDLCESTNEWEFKEYTVPVNIGGLDVLADYDERIYAMSNPAGDDWMSDSPLVNAFLDEASDEDLGFDYDERDDESLWHLDTDHQHVSVATYLDGFGDGRPRAAIGVQSNTLPDPDGARCAYFTVEQLDVLVDYLGKVRDLLLLEELADQAAEQVVVAA